MADTIFALSSGRPPAAISVIRVSGPQAHVGGERDRRITCPSRGPRLFAICGILYWRVDRRSSGPSLCLRRPARPAKIVVEFQCHGGRAVVDALLGALAAIDGLRLAGRASSPAARSTMAAST